MSKHTPGPWLWFERHLVQGNDEDNIPINSKTVLSPDDYWVHVSEADSQLIATAPDLLEALKALLLEMYQSGAIEYMNESSNFAKTFNERLNAAERAVAKAEGK